MQYQYTRAENNQGASRESLLFSLNTDSMSYHANKIELIHRTVELESRRQISQTVQGSDIAGVRILYGSTYTKTTLPADPGMDMDYWGAEKTSSRIADMASSMAELWKINNPGKSKEDFEQFLGKLKGAVQEGFSSAAQVLNGVITGSVQDLVSNTYAQTLSKIDKAFAEKQDHFLQA